MCRLQDYGENIVQKLSLELVIVPKICLEVAAIEATDLITVKTAGWISEADS